MTKTWIIFDGFLNAHKIVCIYYVTEILAERSVKNSKKKKKNNPKSCEKYTKRKSTKKP